MDDKPRYRLRANSVALTRLQWWVVGVAMFVGVIGIVLALTGRAFGSILTSLSILIGSFTIISVAGRGPSK
jgi:hypothetical protein